LHAQTTSSSGVEDDLDSDGAASAKSQSNSGGDAATGATTLAFKGVVFNEMKGAMSDSGQLFSQRLQEAVFASPHVPYHYNR